MTPSVIFLIGMPRSGTKLLRDLLNHHKDVAIFPHETHFFRPLHQTFAEYGDVTNWDAFSKLYADFQNATFFKRMEKRGSRISADDWFRELRGSEFRHVLEALFATYRKMTGCPIVGDKTPEYIMQLPLLGRAFPRAKFVHIFRDPRDYALSIRKAWQKNLPRATQRWKQGIRKCRADASRCKLEYVEVRYEDLVTAPRQTLSHVCGFLGIQFCEDMLVFDHPSENIGDARGALTVVSDNFGKWNEQLGEYEIKKLEAIAGALMVELGYSVVYQAGDQDLGPGRMAIARAQDAVNLLRYTIKEEKGILAGLRQTRRVARFS